jgi:nickel transport system substrate-binding protein
MDPHTYRPNEFWASNWVYEGLVAYGANGVIEPSLAISWTISDKTGGGQEYRFELRQNVLFHDGSAWNCNAAKLNFDHVLAGTTNPNGPHRWYDLPRKITAWTCASAYELVVTTKDKYYPLLQELTYIRPLRMLSPASFKNGPSTDAMTENSCNVEASDDDYHEGVTCAGITGPSGTGPYQYIETMPNGDVKFKSNSAYWRGAPQILEITVKKFQTNDGVMAALLDGSLDAVMGADVLKPADVAKLRMDYTSQFHVFLGPPIQNRMVIINANKAPTDNIQLRKAIIHAVNKAAIIDKELYGLAEPADALFPKDAPYCNIDLTPRWDYDFEKARLLHCPPTVITDQVENVTAINAEKAALAEQLAKEKEALAQAQADKAALQKEVDQLREAEVSAAWKERNFVSAIIATVFFLLL